MKTNLWLRLLIIAILVGLGMIAIFVNESSSQDKLPDPFAVERLEESTGEKELTLEERVSKKEILTEEEVKERLSNVKKIIFDLQGQEENLKEELEKIEKSKIKMTPLEKFERETANLQKLNSRLATKIETLEKERYTGTGVAILSVIISVVVSIIFLVAIANM